jgi:RimJ/RimL family protein N-acetyltransferase
VALAATPLRGHDGRVTTTDELAAPPPTFPAAPPARLELPEDRALVRCRPDLAAAASVAINESLEHLRPWMAWAAEPATEAGMATFFTVAAEHWDQRHDFTFSIVEGVGDGRVVGGCGLHGRLGLHGLEIGYWVHADCIGRGLATACARALTGAAFVIDGIELVRIQCEASNVRSARVPEKLGYAPQEVAVPDDGPCQGRPTQMWVMERVRWVAGATGSAS